MFHVKHFLVNMSEKNIGAYFLIYREDLLRGKMKYSRKHLKEVVMVWVKLFPWPIKKEA